MNANLPEWVKKRINQIVKDKDEAVLKISFKNGGVRNAKREVMEHPPK